MPKILLLRLVRKTINSMKSNKAADMSGLTAEHVKYGGDVLTEYLTSEILL